jgi:VWFA-related protein
MQASPQRHRFLGVLLCLPLVLAQASASLAEEDPWHDIFFDTVDVRLMDVEVVVTDRDGQPVTGLAAEDFMVLEDGEEVEISHFLAVEGRRRQADHPGAEDDGHMPPYTARTERLHLVVVIDNLNTRPENRNALLLDLQRFLRRELNPQDRVMLVTLEDRIEVAHPFTNDVAALEEALEGLKRTTGRLVGFEAQVSMLQRRIQNATLDISLEDFADVTGEEMAITDAQRLARDVHTLSRQRLRRVEQTVVTLRHLTDALAGLGGRKALLYLSDGIPSRPAGFLAQAWINKFEWWAHQVQNERLLSELQDMMLLVGSGQYDASHRIAELIDHASASRVAFYPISVAGLRQTAESAEYAGVDTTSGRGAFSRDVMHMDHMDREMALLELAEGSGGIAFTGTPNIGRLLQRIEQDFTHFYSLGYSPRAEADNERRQVEVRLRNGDGLQVRHTRYVEVQDPLDRLQELTLSALHFELQHNPLQMHLEPGEPVRTGRNRYLVPVMVQIPIQNLLLLPSQEVHAGQVSLFVVARDDRGGMSAMQQIVLPIRIPNHQLAEALQSAAAYPMELEMERGSKRIAVGSRDHLGRVDSTAILELTVGEGR